MSGYIKLYRKLLENPIIKKPELLQLWVYCLLKANYDTKTAFLGSEEIEVQRGQFITGRFELAYALNCKSTTGYNRLQTLRRMGFINTKSNNKNTLVTVLNWELYQSQERDFDNKNDNESDNKMTTNGQQIDTTKNIKNIRNKENNNKAFDDFFESIWKLYPNKKGKGSVKSKQKEVLYKIGYDELKRCIERYKETKEDWKAWKDGSTFFNSGYVDYLDKNYSDVDEGEGHGTMLKGGGVML